MFNVDNHTNKSCPFVGWVSVDEMLPEEGMVVETIICDGNGIRNRAELKRVGNLWFVPDCSMYMYYTPTHWKILNRNYIANDNTDSLNGIIEENIEWFWNNDSIVDCETNMLKLWNAFKVWCVQNCKEIFNKLDESIIEKAVEKKYDNWLNNKIL